MCEFGEWLKSFLQGPLDTGPGMVAAVDNEGPARAITYHLQQTLPDRHAQFAEAYALSAVRHRPAYTSNINFALLLVGLIDREAFYKGGGWALRPKGPGGTGDFLSRWYDEIPAWAVELDLTTGETKPDEDGNTLHEVNPPNFAGAEVAGWGYGLGQMDFVVHRNWLASNNWKDPYVNLDKAGQILADNCNRLGNLRYGTAAYNAGVTRVSTAVANRRNPDDYTTGGDYSQDVFDRAERFGFTV